MNARLKKIRKFLGLSQKDFANMLNIGLRTYQTYESGDRDPLYSVITKLSEIGIDINWLISGEGSMLNKHLPDGITVKDIEEYQRISEKIDAQIKENALLDEKMRTISERLEELDDEARDMMLESFLTILKAKVS